MGTSESYLIETLDRGSAWIQYGENLGKAGNERLEARPRSRLGPEVLRSHPLESKEHTTLVLKMRHWVRNQAKG